MFNIFTDAAIEAVQNAKKAAVKTFVTNEALAKSFNEVIDAQSEYTKQFVNTLFNVQAKVLETFSDSTFYKSFNLAEAK